VTYLRLVQPIETESGFIRLCTKEGQIPLDEQLNFLCKADDIWFVSDAGMDTEKRCPYVLRRTDTGEVLYYVTELQELYLIAN